MSMSDEDYIYMYGQLNSNKIPSDILEKILEGDDLNPEEEARMKEIIENEKTREKITHAGKTGANKQALRKE